MHSLCIFMRAFQTAKGGKGRTRPSRPPKRFSGTITAPSDPSEAPSNTSCWDDTETAAGSPMSHYKTSAAPEGCAAQSCSPPVPLPCSSPMATGRPCGTGGGGGSGEGSTTHHHLILLMGGVSAVCVRSSPMGSPSSQPALRSCRNAEHP